MREDRVVMLRCVDTSRVRVFNDDIKAEIIPRTRLGRLALRILSWRGFRIKGSFLDEPKHDYVTVNMDELLRSICLSQMQIRMIWHEEVSTILVGRDVIDQFDHELCDKFNSFFSYTIEMPLSNGREYKYRGMKVQFIPWMNGMVLIP